MLLSKFPPEIIQLITYFLDAADIKRLASTCTKLRTILLPDLWHYLFINIDFTEELLSKGVIFRDFLHQFGFIDNQKPCPDLCKFVNGPHKCIKNYINIDSGRVLSFFQAVNNNNLSQQLQLVKVLVVNLPILRTFEQEGLLEQLRLGLFRNVKYFGLLKNGDYQLENILDVFRTTPNTSVIIQVLHDNLASFHARLGTFHNLKVLRLLFDDQMADGVFSSRIQLPRQLEFLEINDSYSLQTCERDLTPLLSGLDRLKALELNLWVCDVADSCTTLPESLQSLSCYFGKNTDPMIDETEQIKRVTKPNITKISVGDYGARIFKTLHFPNVLQLEVSKTIDFDPICMDYLPQAIDYGAKLCQILFLNISTDFSLRTGLLDTAINVESLELYFATMQITVDDVFVSSTIESLNRLKQLKTLVLHFELGRFDDFAPFLAKLVYECPNIKTVYYKGTGATEFLEFISDPPAIYIFDGVTYRSMSKPAFHLNKDLLVKRGRHLS